MISDVIDSLARGDTISFMREIKRVVESSIRSAEDAIYNAIDMLTSGVAMVVDDIKDFGKLDRPHHWLWGVILAIAGIIMLGVALYFLLKPK